MKKRFIFVGFHGKTGSDLAGSTASFGCYDSRTMICITDESARAFWDSAKSIEGVSSRCSIASLEDASADIDALASANVPRCAIVGGLLHVLVGWDGRRRQSRHVRSCVLARPLPTGSLRRVSENAVVISPELLFVRMANKLSLTQTIQLGNELCGTYLQNPADPNQLQRSSPLTTKRKLHSYVERVGVMPGVRKARKALDYIVELSNSPMETALEMLLCLPRWLGGYNLPTPRMNFRIDLSREEAVAAGRSFFKCDLYWPDERYALEYYGSDWHTGRKEVARDARRQGDLQFHGIDIAVVTYEQISTVYQSELLSKKVARQLGARLERPSNRCLQARMRLHNELLSHEAGQ